MQSGEYMIFVTLQIMLIIVSYFADKINVLQDYVVLLRIRMDVSSFDCQMSSQVL